MNNLQIEIAKSAYCDKDRMQDMLCSQKFITENYSTFTNECVTPAVKTSFMNILTEEHQIQNEVFSEMQKRGWYQTEAADQNKINQTKQKYNAAL